MAGAKVTANFAQELTPYLRGIANRQVEDFAYKSIRTFLAGRRNVAVLTAKRLTQQKYPLALVRDGKRRYPDGPHLQDCWKYDLSGNVGEHPTVKLVNTREKSTMLIMGIGSPSVIKPKNFMYKMFGSGKKVPVLVYPPGDGRTYVPFAQTVKNPHTVIRPVPKSQLPVEKNDSIGWKALVYAFETAADSRVRRKG